MKNVLVLCTGNSCRSQMGEAILRNILDKNNLEDIAVYSAGIEKHGLNPWAMKVLNEKSFDTSKLSSKTLEDISEVQFEYVLTVCSNAHETCPVFPGNAKVIHHGFEDPPFLAKGLESEDEILPIYRKVRDEIENYLEKEFLNHLSP